MIFEAKDRAYDPVGTEDVFGEVEKLTIKQYEQYLPISKRLCGFHVC